MSETSNMDHVKSNCSWDMFLWKKFRRTTHCHEFFRNVSILYPW